MRVHHVHQSQINTQSELLVIMCTILVSQQCILGQGNLVVVLLYLTIKCCIMKRLYCNYAESMSYGFDIHNFKAISSGMPRIFCTILYLVRHGYCEGSAVIG